MSDTTAEDFKKCAVKGVNDWASDITKLQKKLSPIDDDLKKLEANKSPSPDEKKKIKDLHKQQDALRAEIHDAGTELGKCLIAIPPVAQADPKQLLKLPPFIDGLIKDKGIRLGPDVVLKPDISFDFKKKKIKEFGLTLTWKF